MCVSGHPHPTCLTNVCKDNGRQSSPATLPSQTWGRDHALDPKGSGCSGTEYLLARVSGPSRHSALMLQPLLKDAPCKDALDSRIQHRPLHQVSTHVRVKVAESQFRSPRLILQTLGQPASQGSLQTPLASVSMHTRTYYERSHSHHQVCTQTSPQEFSCGFILMRAQQAYTFTHSLIPRVTTDSQE